MTENETTPLVDQDLRGRSRGDRLASLRSGESVHRGSVLRKRDSSSRNAEELFACQRCHRVVDELRRVAFCNVLSYLECSVCDACVRSLRALASDLELVEVLDVA